MLLTQRIFWPQIETQELVERLIDFLSEHRILCDEVSLFTEGDGCDLRYVPLPEVERRAAHLRWAVARLRRAGFAVAINVLNTIGHSDEGGPDAPLPAWRPMVGPDGAVARVQPCIADPAFLAYVREKYRLYATCGADRYWIDDDVRIHNHVPVSWACFCDRCLADFGTRGSTTTAPADATAYEWTRDRLAAALAAQPSVRRAWFERNRRSFLAILDAAGAGIAAAQPGASIGFMTVNLSDYSDALGDPGQWAAVLSTHSEGQLWLRPGGGFWDDARPRDLLAKAHRVARLIAAGPSDLKMGYEIENYPYQLGAKSAAMTGLECLVTTATTRLDGLLFDVLDGAGNPLEPYHRFMAELAAWRPLWLDAAALVTGTRSVGWRAEASPRHLEQMPVATGAQLRPGHGEPTGPAIALGLAGLPITVEADALGGLLDGDAAAGMSAAELLALLDRPLIMDATAAERYLALGMGAEIGLAGLVWHREGVHEVAEVHALQPELVGHRRAVTLAYFGQRSAAMDPAPGTETLANLVATGGRVLGAALTLHSRPNGAGIVVLGHLPWMHHLSPERTLQLRRLSHWLLADAVPVILGADRAVTLTVRRDPAGERWLAVVFNPGFDPAPDTRLGWYGDADLRPRLALATPGVTVQEEYPELSLGLPPWGLAIVEWRRP